MKITRDTRIPTVDIRPGLYAAQWMLLPQEVRTRLAEVFALKKTGGSLVQDNRQLSDGYTDKDLEVITLEAMQAFLGTEEKDFLILLTEIRAKVLQDIATEKVEADIEASAAVRNRTTKVKKALEDAKSALETAEQTI